MVNPAWGDVWWSEAPHEKSRPYLILTRDEAIPILTRVLAAPVTSTARGIPTELQIGTNEGLPIECVASMDNLTSVRKGYLIKRMGAIDRARRREVCAAIAAAIDC